MCVYNKSLIETEPTMNSTAMPIDGINGLNTFTETTVKTFQFNVKRS
jgi:hypothetical protein